MPKLPTEGETDAGALVPGVDFSDHRSFWKHGYPAVMITDTAFYRNDNYHAATDTHETLDYETLADVAQALALTIEDLAGSDRTGEKR